MDPYGHQLKIARSTLKLSRQGAAIMGGMTHEQAIRVLMQNGVSVRSINDALRKAGHSLSEIRDMIDGSMRTNPKRRRRSMRRNPEAIHTEVYKDHTIEIFPDESPQNPRTEWDNLGVMVCFHKRYDLGDKGHGFRSDQFSSWSDLRKGIETDHPGAIIMPMYMMDHSGVTIRTRGFGDVDPQGWDWGQIGFIFTSLAILRKAGFKRPTRKQAEKILRSEVETYSAYVSGEVYGFVITNPDGSEGDSSWGYYCIKDAVEAAKESIG